MKKTMLLTGMTFAVLIAAGGAGAQMTGGGQQQMMQGSAQEKEGAVESQENNPSMMRHHMMGGYGMGPGMMGGYGMGPGMMGGYGMGPGKMRYGSPEEFEQFLNATKDMRKRMHDLRFEYGEMMRSPNTTMGDLKKMENEINELQQKVLEKAGE